MTKLIELFTGRGLIIAGIAGILAMVATWRSDVKESGRQEVRASVSKDTKNAIAIGSAGAAKSGTPGVRQRRDPTTRDD